MIIISRFLQVSPIFKTKILYLWKNFEKVLCNLLELNPNHVHVRLLFIFVRDGSILHKSKSFDQNMSML